MYHCDNLSYLALPIFSNKSKSCIRDLITTTTYRYQCILGEASFWADISDLKTFGYNGSNEMKFMYQNWKSSRPLNYFAKGAQKIQKSAIFSKRFLSEIFFWASIL